MRMLWVMMAQYILLIPGTWTTLTKKADRLMMFSQPQVVPLSLPPQDWPPHLHENKRRNLNPRSESIASRYVRLFRTRNIRFPSTGKAVRQNDKSTHPARPHGEFAILAKPCLPIQQSGQGSIPSCSSSSFPGHARCID